MPGKKSMIKKRPTYQSLNKRLKNIESSVRAEETKKYYRLYNEVSITNSTNLTINNQINDLAQGDGASTLDGVSYALTGIAGKFLLHNVNNIPTLVRIAVIRIKSNANFTTAGEDLFTGAQSLGLNYNSATIYQRYFLPFNNKKYDVIYSEDVMLGAKNATYTDQYNANKVVSFYKKFKNRKEFINTSASNAMDTSYRLIMFPVDCAMDSNSLNIEVTGQTIFYYKDN